MASFASKTSIAKVAQLLIFMKKCFRLVWVKLFAVLRYVFYFGKQKSIRYNTFDKNHNKIYDTKKWKLITDKLEFALHSHKSDKPMGKPYSHGCIRMSDELNRFLDNYLVLHKHMFDGKKWLHKYSKEPNDPKYNELAGEYLIIFDKI